MVSETFDEWEKDYSIVDWVGEYVHIKKDIMNVIATDTFKGLLAKNKQDLALGMLTKPQVNKVRKVLQDGFENRKENLKYWKVSMRHASRKFMDSTTTKEEFSRKFNNFLTHHNLRRAINYGKELSK